MIEHRKNHRFELKLPLKVERSGSKPLDGTGETENISLHGVLFRTTFSVQIGTPLEYSITLAHSPGDPSEVTVHCLGKVLRCEPSSETPDPDRPYQMVATIERYRFVREPS